MTWLWILLGVVILLVLLSLLPVRLCFFLNEKGLKFSVRLIRLPLFSTGKQKQKKEEEEEKKKKKKPGKPLSLSRLMALLEFGCGLFGSLKLKLAAVRLCFLMVLGLDDAADTALAVGGVNAAVNTLIGVLSWKTKVKEHRVEIAPAWNQMRLSVDARLSLSLRLGNLVLAFFRGLVYTLRNREKIKDIR